LKDKHAEDLINILENIETTIKGIYIPQNNTGMKKVYQLRDGFFHQLTAKTSWGRNQLTEIFLNLIKEIEEENL